MNRFLLLGVAALLCGAFSSPARGQDTVLAELYGQGVHSYFSGDYFTAQDLLSGAIQQGSKDPRAYYFRGLTYHRIGRLKEGDADLKMGAHLEANGSERVYPVSDSLQRVQGQMRMQIEKQRQLARLASRSRQNQAEQARYQQMERSGAASSPKRGAAMEAGPIPAAPAGADKTDPFVDDAEAKPQPARARPPAVVAEPKPEASDPFGAVTPATTAPDATAKPAEAPAETPGDPFGTPAAPATPAAPETPAPKAEPTDPFGTAEQPADAPMAEKPPAEQPAAEKPAPMAADDPFATP